MTTVYSNSGAHSKMAAIDVDDLLSDDSNDSFFEDPKLLAKRSSITKTTAEKKSVADIFGITEENAETKKGTDGEDWLGLGGAAKKIKDPVKKVGFEEDAEILSSLGMGKKVAGDGKDERKQKKEEIKKSGFAEDDDILSSLGFSKKPAVETQKNPTSKKTTGLFDDILGTSPKRERKNVDFSDILTESKPKKEELAPTTTSREISRRSRSATSTSTALADPLGLFSNKQPDEAGDAGRKRSEAILPSKPKPAQTRSAPNITALPDWLSAGTSPVKQHKSEPDLPSAAAPPTPEKPVTKEETLETPVLDTLIAQQKLATANVGLQNTAIAMQQQESQLVVALQLKKYEDKLVDMQRQQQEILLKQDRQFNDLLQQQFLKQQVLEESMRQQQQRIQSHIELLLQQPLSSGGGYLERTEDLKRAKEDETVKLYEDIIGTLKQRQHEEMFLLEESYKKQINFLEQSMQSLETRLKTDLETALETYHNKLKQTDNDYKEQITKYQEKLEQMSEQQANEIKMIRENHLRVVEEIKNEYNLLTESLKQTKSTENELLAGAGEYAQKLDKSLNVLDTNSRALLEIQSTIEKNSGAFYSTREESIKAKEEEIKMMRSALEKARAAAETERAQLMGLVRTLEMKIVEQNQNAREERWALQQATATLTAKAAALDREADFNRSLLEREREQIKTLKAGILAEQERSMLMLTEQRLVLEAEKSRVETAAKLNRNYDPQVARAEIEAAVQVAREAAELTDKEREKLQRQQYEFESIKRNLLDKERKLTLKERELDILLQKAESKIRDGENAMDCAKMLEIKYNERMKDLQKQMASLTARERKMAEEKIELSRERLALHTLVRQNRKCGLCAVDNGSSKNGEEHVVEPDLHDFNVVEGDIHRLRMEISGSNEDLLHEFSNKD